MQSAGIMLHRDGRGWEHKCIKQSQCLLTDEPDSQNQMDSVSEKNEQLIKASKRW